MPTGSSFGAAVLPCKACGHALRQSIVRFRGRIIFVGHCALAVRLGMLRNDQDLHALTRRPWFAAEATAQNIVVVRWDAVGLPISCTRKARANGIRFAHDISTQRLPIGASALQSEHAQQIEPRSATAPFAAQTKRQCSTFVTAELQRTRALV